MRREMAHQVAVLSVNAAEDLDGRPQLDHRVGLLEELDHFFAQPLYYRLLYRKR